MSIKVQSRSRGPAILGGALRSLVPAVAEEHRAPARCQCHGGEHRLEASATLLQLQETQNGCLDDLLQVCGSLQ